MRKPKRYVPFPTLHDGMGMWVVYDTVARDYWRPNSETLELWNRRRDARRQAKILNELEARS